MAKRKCVGCGAPFDASASTGSIVVSVEFYGIPSNMSGACCSPDCAPKAMREWASAFERSAGDPKEKN